MAAAAGIGAAGSLLGGVLSSKGAAKAAKIQAAAYQQGLAQQQAQYQQQRTDFEPYRAAGTGALSGMGGLLGLQGDDVQGAAIDHLKGSPAFTSLFNTGADTILQNASATGGLRGGNVQGSLANFGSSLLAQVIQQHLQNLGGLASMGEGSTQALSQLGQQNTNNQTQLLGQIGNANATRAAAPYAAAVGVLQGLGQQFGGGFGGGSGGFGGSGGSGGGGAFPAYNGVSNAGSIHW